MKNKLKIDDIDPEQRWAWAAEINGMGTVADQIPQLLKFVLRQGSIFDDENQVMMDAADNGTIKEPNGALVVVGIRVLGRDWGDAFATLGATGDFIYSISTSYLYDCSSTDDFNKADKEYRKQVMIPAHTANKAKGQSGPDEKLTSDMLKTAQLKRNSDMSLRAICVDLLKMYPELDTISTSTISRRTTPRVIKANREKSS